MLYSPDGGLICLHRIGDSTGHSLCGRVLALSYTSADESIGDEERPQSGEPIPIPTEVCQISFRWHHHLGQHGLEGEVMLMLHAAHCYVIVRKCNRIPAAFRNFHYTWKLPACPS